MYIKFIWARFNIKNKERDTQHKNCGHIQRFIGSNFQFDPKECHEFKKPTELSCVASRNLDFFVKLPEFEPLHMVFA